MIFGIDFSNIVFWLLFGLLVGVIAHLVDPADVRGGLIGTIITGIVGALIGGFVANTLFGLSITGFNLQSLLIAVAGALVLSFLERWIFRRGNVRTDRM